MMNDMFENVTCACCGASGNNMQRCSACKKAMYCNRTCQTSHWPEHKPRCKIAQEAKKFAKENGMKRSARLVEEWKEKVKHGLLEGALYYHFGLKKLRTIQDKKEVVVVSGAFDFNLKTFLPTQAPEVLPMTDFEQHSDTIDKKYDEERNRPGVLILVLLQMEELAEIPSILPCLFDPNTASTSKQTWNDTMLLFREVKLTSSKFDTWSVLQTENLKKQLQGGLRNHNQFQKFLVNALQLESNNQLHKEKVIVVNMELGSGLGEIKELKSFELWTVDKTIQVLTKAFGESNPQVEYYKTNLLDFDNSPFLLESRLTHPKNILVSVFFVGKPVLFGMPNGMELMDGHNVYSVKHCKKKAEKAFEALQKFKLPKVSSPDLNL